MFWFMVSKVSVHDRFGSVMRQNIIAESMWWNKAAHITAAREQRQRKGLGRYRLQRHAKDHFLQLGPTP